MYNNSEEKIMVKNLFGNGSIYCIPLYQRDYAWGFDEVQQLILDIDSIDEKTREYYIGTLVVYKREDGSFEVIDGQQRLTTLFLLFSQIEDSKKAISGNNVIKFDCRSESNECLKRILEEDDIEKIEGDNPIIVNAKTIKRMLKSRPGFNDKLKRVVLFRVEVPPFTDLNHYFEIMNTRGEQLEHTDIIKSRLMSKLDTKQHAIFSEIWDACSDMGHYVQIGVKTSRDDLFNENWDDCPSTSCLDIEKDYTECSHNSNTISWAIAEAKSNNLIKAKKYDENNQEVDTGYNSIISFPYFLLHAFRIFAKKEMNKPIDLLGSTLNDRLLIKDFEAIFGGGNSCSKEDATKFIDFLLRLRFLFDKYIVKRYCVDSPSDGIWTIRSYIKNLDKNKPGYKATFSTSDADENDDEVGQKCKMLQSCLRVSFTSPRVMHWITHTLGWLYDKYKNKERIDGSDLNDYLIDYIVNGKKEDGSVTIKEFLETGAYSLGVDTPNLIFNFLDYCIWNNDAFQIKGKERFRFEFRNSVEHYYPQHPETFDLEYWEQSELDRFGNLALLQRNINSTFSNSPPNAKRDYINNYVEKNPGSMSLKLRLMAGITTDDNKKWGTVFEQHEKEMLNILREACGLPQEL